MLFGWMKNIIIYLILSGIVINISPGNNYKKYINFLSGLIVIVILAEPLTYIFNLSVGDIDSIYNEAGLFVEESYGEGNFDNSGEDYYSLSLNESILSYLEGLGYDVEEVSVITDKDNNITECIIITGEKADLCLEIKNIISEVYNVEVNSIYIVRR
ncbi:MAG: hypothetical protein E7259_01650 [Lachnospiraceae bacterium]|nr:hypothetical protein [Lachnospiraceae bacterium]